ncbi:uncharacterized protein L969DRAFT_50467 [Mixia osmundae IAM 14324]|uniref:Uncharacterized protein n=1 Tax=Mixia osmundae (strain CBS 9802 / IAM 14324 / JCM 22182 / KY 12970) TaxID=764103 RepID=G7E1Z7_MIXOS|nr:uncharacterized protein L969DRAFT_50467 [Mixia osmundae IAM 14324]KEI38707.1 hypothetical protein L969DRAFT_50467 [Mixia osmundae IAM 14324]GAA96834.1 hypothetical protein E5Q_03507 [Mixia osmundae IAM 14324]
MHHCALLRKLLARRSSVGFALDTTRMPTVIKRDDGGCTLSGSLIGEGDCGPLSGTCNAVSVDIYAISVDPFGNWQDGSDTRFSTQLVKFDAVAKLYTFNLYAQLNWYEGHGDNGCCGNPVAVLP